MKNIAGIGLALLVVSCATAPPRNVGDVCEIFRDKQGWYQDAQKSRKKWGVPISVQMAIIRQESNFHAKAKPKRKKLLGMIPMRRPSSAFGYAQATDGTWKWYAKSAGNWGADRDDFADAVDFVGWYVHQSAQKLGIAKSDAHRQYLAYHEGHGGYKRKTYRNKKWLLRVADKVAVNAKRYRRQLTQCEASLQRKRGWFF